MQLSASRRNGSSIDFRGSRVAGEVGAPYGPVIDNVSVVEAIAIPAPGGLAILGLGLAGLGFARRKRAA